MVELGLPVAIATDCNPGSSYTESMPFVFGLAVLGMGLSVNEALVGLDAERRVRDRRGRRRPAASRPASARTCCCSRAIPPASLAFHAGVSAVAAVYAKGVRAWPAKGFHP